MRADQKAPKPEQTTKSRPRAPKVLMGLSVFFVLVGGTIIDPLAGFTCFVLAGILALLAALYGTRRLRYIAFVLLIIVIALAVSKFPEASHHFKSYKERGQERSSIIPEKSDSFTSSAQ